MLQWEELEIDNPHRSGLLEIFGGNKLSSERPVTQRQIDV